MNPDKVDQSLWPPAGSRSLLLFGITPKLMNGPVFWEEVSFPLQNLEITRKRPFTSCYHLIMLEFFLEFFASIRGDLFYDAIGRLLFGRNFVEDRFSISTPKKFIAGLVSVALVVAISLGIYSLLNQE